MNKLLKLTFALCLAGCAGSQTDIRMKEGSGDISVQPASSADYDYLVMLKNRWDIGYEPDRKADRDAMALRYMKSQCPAATIAGETESVDSG